LARKAPQELAGGCKLFKLWLVSASGLPLFRLRSAALQLRIADAVQLHQVGGTWTAHRLAGQEDGDIDGHEYLCHK